MEAEENAEKEKEDRKEDTEDTEEKKSSRPGTPDTVTTAKPPTINAPKEEPSDASPTTTDTDDAQDIEHTKPPVLRAFVLRPPPRRVIQKRSYESINSLGSSTATTTVHTASASPTNEIIVTPSESMENLREDSNSTSLKTIKEGTSARPTSVATVAFGTH